MKSVYVAGMLLLVGCNGQTLEVGNDGTAGSSSSANNTTDLATELGAAPICDEPVVNAPDANWPDPVACAAAAAGVQSSIVGVWEGYSEDEYFVPTGGKFHIEILAASPGGSICGTVRRGAGPVPTLSDDPATMYPPLDSSYYYGMQLQGVGSLIGWLDGANYSIISGGMADNQVRFKVSRFEHLKAWCALQNAYENGQSLNGYNCAPGADLETGVFAHWETNTCTMTVHGVERVLSFAHCRYCTLMGDSPCACDSCHCTARIGELISFDLTFNGDLAIGLYHDNSGTQNLRLKRLVP